MATRSFPVTGDPDVDQLLVADPLALLIGMLLDQQVPMEWAFRAPYTLRNRLGGLDATAIAAMDPVALETVFRDKPALHRYPVAMAKRTHALCTVIATEYGGDASRIWTRVRDADVLWNRLRALPGFGEEKARIFMALLAKRMGKKPVGWEEIAKPFSDEQPRSVADIDSRESFARVRAWKQAQKAMGKGKAD
ncbi:MAG: (Fe-S)-cluster assembly protein [Actinomycetia bacterium]|nr:(Fe-S)-cluster assembly protein [Actinomycetes bacterium]